MVRSHLKIPLVIAGPTGSGKSALAFYLAKKYNAEIICADSRQFYLGMSIGTAAPNYFEQNKVAHHGYGFIDPKTSSMDAGFFVNFAKKQIREINERGKRAILVGGSGLYLRALCYGLDDMPKSLSLRASLEQRIKLLGLSSLYAELKDIDLELATKINAYDAVRISRALEIYYLTKKKPSSLRTNFSLKEKKLNAHWLYLDANTDWLLKRLFDRCEDMFKKGLIEEAGMLRESLPPNSLLLKTMGYEEALLVLDKKISEKEAIERTFIRHRQYAKRQRTWFNKETFYCRLDATKIRAL